MKTKRILIIEDGALSVKEMGRKMQKLGFAKPPAVQARKEGLETALREKADLAFVDINLHGERDGIELARKKCLLGIPLIHTNAITDEETLQNAAKSDSNGYLTKQIGSDPLLTSIEIAFYKQKIVVEH